jgi:hypothetical protein
MKIQDLLSEKTYKKSWIIAGLFIIPTAAALLKLHGVPAIVFCVAGAGFFLFISRYPTQ